MYTTNILHTHVCVSVIYLHLGLLMNKMLSDENIEFELYEDT